MGTRPFAFVMSACWIVERTQDARFPWRIRIEQDGRILLAVRAQSRWPGAGMQVFCLREREPDPGETLIPHEVVPIAHLARIGRKLSVSLDRPQHKRCEFLKLEKPRKDGGSYEQIFFRTEAAVRGHRSSTRTELVANLPLEVAVDSAERYPWRFPGAHTTRRRLPVGDYALLHEQGLAAVVERKTRENFLADLAELKGLQQQLSELGSYPHAALVLEAPYRDFGDPARLGPWPAAHVQRVLAELPVLFPRVQLIFAGNRKLANLWAQRWFAAVAASLARPAPDGVREALAGYRAAPADGGLDTGIRLAVVNELPDGFAIASLRQRFPDVSPIRLKRVLDQLRDEGRIRREGHGRGARWRRV
jgi:hypothetical protein